MSVTLIVRMKAKPGHGDAVRRLLSPLPPENDIQGCLGWEIFSNASNSDDVMIVEHWTSVTAHRAFIGPLIASGDLNEIQSHIVSTERTYYTKIETTE
jgi:antibiotic biosynthesis monooxygenase